MPRYGPYVFKYNPPITLYFDSDEHIYLREFGAELVPQFGVTTVLNIMDKPWLKPWVAKKTVEKVLATMPREYIGGIEHTKPMLLAEFADLLTAAKKAHKEILEDAGDVGTEAHRSLEHSIKFAISTNKGVVEKLTTVPPDPRAVSCCGAGLKWMSAHNVRWLSAEQKVYSREYEYAGTFDGLCYVDSCSNIACCPVRFVNRLSLADWKSSNQLSLEYLWQAAAYRYALIEETGAEITDAFILRLGKEDGEFEPWHASAAELDEDFKAFLACLELTGRHEQTKLRMAAAKKARTARKRLVKKVAAW